MGSPVKVWRHRTGELVLDQTRVMGVLNVTPDSFSDGGRYFYPDAALRHGLDLVDAGADLVDVGGESTRPGSDPVSAEEEWRRVGPLIRGLAEKVQVPLSIDPMKPDIAAEAIDARAALVNDLVGEPDPSVARLLAKSQAGGVAMYMHENPN